MNCNTPPKCSEPCGDCTQEWPRPDGSEVDGERAKFEAWAKDRAHPFHDREPLLNNGAIDRFSDIAWQAWQAALSTRPQQAGAVHSNQSPAEAHEKPVAFVRHTWTRSGARSLVFEKPDELSLAEEATGVEYEPLYAAAHARRPDAGAAVEARRYRRLQILGAAPFGSKNLDTGTVLRFQSLDAFVDADISAHPSRGESAQPEAAQPQPKGISEYCQATGCAHQAAQCPVWKAGERPPYANEHLAGKLENIISGYSINADDADWLRALPVQAPAPGAGDKWDGAEEWMPLAWELCANECGEEACTELIWEGGPIPEPWGDRWLKYEDQAKEMIAMVRKHVRAQANVQPKGTATDLAVFGSGPFHVETRTNAHAEICNTQGRAVAQFSWSVDATARANALCALLNSATRSPAPAPEAPTGYKLVPVEPTPQMRKAAADAWLDCDSKLILNKAASALRAGIAAAPKEES